MHGTLHSLCYFHRDFIHSLASLCVYLAADYNDDDWVCGFCVKVMFDAHLFKLLNCCVTRSFEEHVSISLVVYPLTKHIDMQLLMRLLIMQLQSRDDNILLQRRNFREFFNVYWLSELRDFMVSIVSIQSSSLLQQFWHWWWLNYLMELIQLSFSHWMAAIQWL